MPTFSDLSMPQVAGLDRAVERSSALIDTALKLLSTGDRADELAARFILAPGLERIMKTTLVLAHLGDQVPLVDSDLKGRFGHDLVALRDALVELADRSPRFSAPALHADLEFVRGDPLLEKLFAVLTSYGMGGRYTEFRLLTGEAVREEPDAVWDEVEVEQLTSVPGWHERDLTDPAVVDEMVIPALVHVLRVFLRFIARLWAFDALGEVGTSWSVQLDAHLRYRADP